MWFLYSLICIIGWGTADLFYKKSSTNDDKYSHLKIAVWVGISMGVVSIILLPFSESDFSFLGLIKNGVKYAPASLSYIISMVIGYVGLRFLEVSIISPVQNASGALSTIVMVVYFAMIGEFDKVGETFSILDIIGTAIIVIGVIALAVVENKVDKVTLTSEEKKNRFGSLALIFPLLYCIFDTIGTSTDGIILDEEFGLGLGEIDVLILYGLTFLLCGIGAWVFMLIKGEKYNPFKLAEFKTKGVASIAEEFGQIFYVLAFSKNAMIAAPLVSSYCVLSVALSRIFLKEKLKVSQYLCIFAVILGIIMLGVSEGLGSI